MTLAQKGSQVSVHYTGTFDDGSVFDSSRDKEPLSFVIGEGTVIPGFEDALLGMAPGEVKNVSIPPEEGYGLHSEEMVIHSPVDDLPVTPEVGMVFQADVQGQTMYFMVAAVEDNVVTLDGNHPMAGKQLHFELELVAVA